MTDKAELFLTVSLPPEMGRAFRQIAHDKKISRSAIARELIQDYINKEGK